MNKLTFSPAALLLLVSCKGFPLFWSAGMPPLEPPARAHVELQNVRYDGQTLSGRLLIAAEENRLRLDKRLIESVYLTTESISDCSTGQTLPFLVMDVLASRPREEDILVLKPGYWYGKDVSIPLFTESLSQQFHPACIDAEFSFHALGGETAARLRVRAERSDQHP
jgi:hypothetical protein